MEVKVSSSIYWPVSLPNAFQQNSFSFNPQGNVLRTDMDSGAAKVRRLFTAVPEDYSGDMVFTKAQFTIFKVFFGTTLGYGVSTFNFPNQFDLENTIEVRFIIESNNSPYTLVPDGTSLDWKISFKMETIP